MSQTSHQRLLNKIIVADLALFAFLAIFSKLNSYFPVDLSVSRSIQSFQNPLFDSLMRFLSFVGEPRISLSLLLAFSLMLFLFQLKKDAVVIVVSGFLLTLMTEALKISIHRSRPSPLLVHQFLPELTSPSFPSWHVLIFIAIFGYFLFIIQKRFRVGALKKVLEIICVLLILLMGTSRIYLGMHWLSDVLGSFLLGFAWLAIVAEVSHGSYS